MHKKKNMYFIYLMSNLKCQISNLLPQTFLMNQVV